VITKPWPGMLRTLYKDPERYRKQYWSAYRASISPGTPRESTRTAISGLSAGSTT